MHVLTYNCLTRYLNVYRLAAAPWHLRIRSTSALLHGKYRCAAVAASTVQLNILRPKLEEAAQPSRWDSYMFGCGRGWRRYCYNNP